MGSNNRVGNARNEMLNELSIQVEGKLCALPVPPPEKTIFKVHNQLRRVNEKAYEPECVAIGPYHHYNDDRPHLQYMEEQKLHYLQQMLRRRRETSVIRYMQALNDIEVKARQQYAEKFTLSSEQFIEMMLLDGCFIIEYFRKYKMKTLRDQNDTLLSLEWIRYSIQRDLLLLENQLPFIVLTTLYDLTKDDRYFDRQYNLIDLAWNFFVDDANADMSKVINHCKHLLDLRYQGLISKVSTRLPIGNTTMGKNNRFLFMRSATELKKSGIKLRSVKSNTFDIQFNKGTLVIPTLDIQDHTEAFLRNLVAYEQHCQSGKTNYVTDYITFMDCLVNIPEDVELLRQKGVIANYLGDDKVVSTMFNKIGEYVTLSNFYYASIFNEVNEQCKKRRNRWMAVLRRDYFHSPWALISILAATLLLLLTLMQTVYTIASYYEKKD